MLLEHTRGEARLFIGDDRLLDACRARAAQGIQHMRKRTTVRTCGFLVVDDEAFHHLVPRRIHRTLRMLPGGFHQPAGAVADPVANLLIAHGLMTKVFQGHIDGFSNFTRCIEQGTVEVIHYECHSSLQFRRVVYDPSGAES